MAPIGHNFAEDVMISRIDERNRALKMKLERLGRFERKADSSKSKPN